MFNNKVMKCQIGEIHGAVVSLVYIVGIAVFFFKLAFYSAENGLNFPLRSLPETVFIKAFEILVNIEYIS